LNDLLDLSTDRADPRKCFEPVASSSVSIVIGTLMMPCLLFAGFALAVSLGRPLFLVVTSVYYVVTVGYSRYSRARDIIGICVLVGLYMARVVAGAAATGIWILI